MTNNKLILTSFSAIAMITMAATMIATQDILNSSQLNTTADHLS
ncbi:MAG TPA: hypothetical protein VEL11_16090 [Candidatus Bathyarchaeia archaeon]|nr:hypothetical protein [Candidatus Bathyarchaeia archaeon]